jgi:hypothetical protein
MGFNFDMPQSLIPNRRFGQALLDAVQAAPPPRRTIGELGAQAGRESRGDLIAVQFRNAMSDQAARMIGIIGIVGAIGHIAPPFGTDRPNRHESAVQGRVTRLFRRSRARHIVGRWRRAVIFLVAVAP